MPYKPTRRASVLDAVRSTTDAPNNGRHYPPSVHVHRGTLLNPVPYDRDKFLASYDEQSASAAKDLLQRAAAESPAPVCTFDAPLRTRMVQQSNKMLYLELDRAEEQQEMARLVHRDEQRKEELLRQRKQIQEQRLGPAVGKRLQDLQPRIGGSVGNLSNEDTGRYFRSGMRHWMGNEKADQCKREMEEDNRAVSQHLHPPPAEPLDEAELAYESWQASGGFTSTPKMGYHGVQNNPVVRYQKL